MSQVNFPQFNEKLLTVVSFTYAFISQRVAQKINDFITQMGLDGRIDVFIIIIMLCVAVAMISSKQKQIMVSENRLAIKNLIKKINKLKIESKERSKQYENNNNNDREDTISTQENEDDIIKLVSEYLGNISILDQHLKWKEFIENCLDFLTLIGTYLLVGYSERFCVIIFGMWNVSTWTIVLILVPILFFLMSLKTVYTDSDILKSEIKVLLQDQ